MNKYAIVTLSGKQFRVYEGDEFVVDKLDYDEGKDFEIDQVLLLNQDGKMKIGQPLVKGAKVVFNLLSHQKSKKLRVAKYKAKSRYRRVYGHRQHQSIVKVKSIKTS